MGQPPFESPTVQDTLLKVKQMDFAVPDFISSNAKYLIASLLSWDPKERLSIHEVLDHAFFKSTQPLDCSYYEYREALLSPPQPFKISKRKTKSHYQNIPPFIIPIHSKNLKPIKLPLRNGEFEIRDDGVLCLSIGTRRMDISYDGLSFFYHSKWRSLRQLKGSCLKLYQYTANLIEAIKSQTPKIIIESEAGKFLLMQNTPFPNFEARLPGKIRVLYQIGSELLRVQRQLGLDTEINVYQDLDVLEPSLKEVVEVCIEGLKQCLHRERVMNIA